jgi:hypothetical protein
MNRGASILLVGGCLAAAGCVTDRKVEVRAIPSPNAALPGGGSLLGLARGHLALGNVGLALESFRTLQRQQPDSVEAFAGIAACYAAMGRNDLARQNYEFALAYAPTDRGLLLALASTLDRLGEGEQATGIRAEVAAMTAAPAVAKASETTPVAVPRVAAVTVKLPPAPAPVANKVPEKVQVAKSEVPGPRAPLPAAAVVLPKAVLEPQLALSAPPAARLRPLSAIKPPEPAVAVPPVLRRVDPGPYLERSSLGEVALITAPEPVKYASLPATPLVGATAGGSSKGEVRLASASPPMPLRMTAEKPREPGLAAPSVVSRVDPGPYLERSSLGEVALITRSEPAWVAPSAAQVAVRADRAQPVKNEVRLASASRFVTPNWVPLRYASAPVQLLNAARVQSLAARSRGTLLGKGWRRVAIGNARKVRRHSLVLYASANAAVARRLAAHFHCRAVQARDVRNVIVLLGRDAIPTGRITARA